MKKFISLSLLLILSVFAFSLKIYPNLIYNIDVEDFNFEYEFFIRNDLNDVAIIKIEKIDFLTDGKKYEFDVPGYKYSVKKYVELDEYEFELQPNEERKIKLRFNIPTQFNGASGIFALKISQESKNRSQIQIRLNYIVPFFLRFKNITPIQNIQIVDVNLKNLAMFPDEKHGSYGSLITLHLKNNGNVVFLPQGSIKISSLDLKTIINDVKIDSFDFVIFPENESFYTFKIPQMLPKGNIRISLSGESYGMRFSLSKEIEVKEAYDKVKVVASPTILVYDIKNLKTVQNFIISNLTSYKGEIKYEILDLQSKEPTNLFVGYPKLIRLYPYKNISFKIRSNLKEIDHEGDKIFIVKSKFNGESIFVDDLLIVLRGTNLRPEIETDYNFKDKILNVKNVGNCLLKVNLEYNNMPISKEIILKPNEEKDIILNDNISISRVILKYQVFGINKVYTKEIR